MTCYGPDAVYLEEDIVGVDNEHRQFTCLLQEQSCWANVCTEPGMVAFMAANAASALPGTVTSIEVHLSAGVLKNALSAGLPHTTQRGPAVAAAAGAISRQPERGLTILGDLTPTQVDEALSLVAAGSVKVKWDTSHQGVYGKCIVRNSEHTSEVVVSGSHTGIVEQRLDGKPVPTPDGHGRNSGLSILRGWTFDHLIDTVMTLPASEFGWLLDGARSCVNLSEADSPNPQAHLATPREACAALSCDGTPLTEAAGRTFKAIEARMSGTPWPVLTSGGKIGRAHV